MQKTARRSPRPGQISRSTTIRLVDRDTSFAPGPGCSQRGVGLPPPDWSRGDKPTAAVGDRRSTGAAVTHAPCMSVTEFTTALVAGLIGLIGTGTGAAATAWAAKIGAIKNIEAARGQAQDQATHEHAHWLRQQRLVAYEGSLDAWDECTRKRKELTSSVDDIQQAALRAELRK
jgi:acetyl-CoA carboxylase carboxyltransferase component